MANHKLITPYWFVIHSRIDRYSRLVVYLHASTNNQADTVFQLFREATTMYNIPSRVRCDMGLQNIEVGRFMLDARGCNRGSIITGNFFVQNSFTGFFFQNQPPAIKTWMVGPLIPNGVKHFSQTIFLHLNSKNEMSPAVFANDLG